MHVRVHSGTGNSLSSRHCRGHAGKTGDNHSPLGQRTHPCPQRSHEIPFFFQFFFFFWGGVVILLQVGSIGNQKETISKPVLKVLATPPSCIDLPAPLRTATGLGRIDRGMPERGYFPFGAIKASPLGPLEELRFGAVFKLCFWWACETTLAAKLAANNGQPFLSGDSEHRLLVPMKGVSISGSCSRRNSLPGFLDFTPLENIIWVVNRKFMVFWPSFGSGEGPHNFQIISCSKAICFCGLRLCAFVFFLGLE